MTIPVGPTYFNANGTIYTGNVQAFVDNNFYPLTGNIIASQSNTTTSI